MWKRGWPGRSLWLPTQVSIRMVWWRVLSTQLWIEETMRSACGIVVGRRQPGQMRLDVLGVPVGQQHVGLEAVAQAFLHPQDLDLADVEHLRFPVA